MFRITAAKLRSHVFPGPAGALAHESRQIHGYAFRRDAGNEPSPGVVEPAIPSARHCCLDVPCSGDPFTDEHRGEQEHRDDQDQGDAQCDHHGRSCAAPFPFESFIARSKR